MKRGGGVPQNKNISQDINMTTYPFLREAVENYFYAYYDFPNNSNDLIRYVESIDWSHMIGEEPLKITIANLKKNKSSIKFGLVGNTLEVNIRENIKVRTFGRNVCEKITSRKDISVRLVNNFQYFDKDGISLGASEIIEQYEEDFKTEIKGILIKYKKVFGLKLYERLQLMEYSLQNGLSFYCKGNNTGKLDIRSDFYVEISKYCENFCKEREISKMTFYLNARN